MTHLPTPVTFDYEALDTDTRLFVQKATHEIQVALRMSARYIIVIGERLIEVKACVGHDNFEKWLTAEFELSIRTAQRYMAVAETFGDSLKNDTVSFLVAAKALYMLSAPSTPEPARKEAIQVAESGERVTATKVKQIIASHKPQPPKPIEPPKHWMDTLVIGKHYPVDRKRGLVVNEPFDNVQECRAAYPGLIPESRAFLLMNRVAFATYRFVAPDQPSPAPEGQALHPTTLDDSTSPDEPAAPRHDPRTVSNTGEWTPGETAYLNRAQAVVNHAHPGKMPFVGNPVDEVARLKARIAELTAENARLVAENIQLRGENASLRNRMQLPDVKPQPPERML